MLFRRSGSIVEAIHLDGTEAACVFRSIAIIESGRSR